MTRVGRAVAAGVAAVALVGGVSSCGTEEDPASGESAADAGTPAADVSTCTSDAEPAPTPYGDGFPDDWPFPPQSVVFNAEDRGGDGTIVTAVSSAEFREILDYMNHDLVDAGFTIESGETEEHDAEAEWEGNGFRGRWAIRESAHCEGETVIQVLSTTE